MTQPTLLSPPLPAPTPGLPLSCASCGYDLAGVTLSICPECATPISEETVLLAERRQQILAQRPAIMRRWAVIHLPMLALGVGGLAAIYLHNSPFDLKEFSLMCAVVTGVIGAVVAIGAGAVLPLLVYIDYPASQIRRLITAVWFRHLWMLSLPWLSIPVLALVLLAISSTMGVRGQRGEAITLGLALLWAHMWLFVFVRWVWCWQRDTAALRLGLQPRRDVGMILGLFVLAVSAILGSVGGSIVLIAVTFSMY